VSESIPAAELWNGRPGTEAEERVAGKASYLAVLGRLHHDLRPSHYLEIGIRQGRSLALARGRATGVDPAPAIDRALPSATEIVALTSDAFFASAPPDLAPDFCFIDGLHLFEYALRDFMNIEQRAAPGTVVVIDDVFPNHPAQAERARRTRVWTGDVWRLIDVLRRYRSDLFLLPLDAAPAGLLLIAGLDPTNRVLPQNYDKIVREAHALPGPPSSVLERSDALDPSCEQVDHVIASLQEARQTGAHAWDIAARLKTALRIPQPQISTRPRLSVVVVSYNMTRELPRTIR